MSTKPQWIALLIVLLSIIILPRSTYAFSGNGSGTSGDPYLITTCNQLQEMEDELSAAYELQNNINCDGLSFISVGNSSTPFTGSLDGANKTISNLSIGDGDSYIGLFSFTGTGTTISNVRLTNLSISSTNDIAGGIVGWADESITLSNSSVEGNIDGDTYTAGLIAVVNRGGTITNSYFKGSLSLHDTGYMGGLIGIFNTGMGNLSNSYSQGTYTATSTPYGIGGLVGITNSGTSTLSNSYSSAIMNVTDGDYFGGLIGITNGGTVNLTNLFSAATLNPTNTDIGGVVGYINGSTITESGLYFDQTLAGTTDCTATGSLTCTAVNNSNGNPNYFKGNNSNPPLNSWDFSLIWKIVSGSYPGLITFLGASSNNSSTVFQHSSTTDTPQCGDSTPTKAPELFAVNAGKGSATLNFVPVSGGNAEYYVTYGLDQNANSYGVSFKNSDLSQAIQFPINSLFPGTWYFKVRGRNGCMPGPWSKVLSTKVTSIFR
jgi:hypothetical protein